jgi:hypothetical protein
MRRVLLAGIAVGAASLSLLGGSATAAPAVPSWLKLARAELPTLLVKPAAPMKGYARAKFGPAWQDVDDNGCDTRDDILKRDLTKVAFKGGSTCVVNSGTLRDPYTGHTIHFVRGVNTSLTVQIDHVVALAAAWRTGAAAWSANRRLVYANDRDVLLAVDGPSNNAKGDDDASQWLPPRASYDCRYVARQIAIKRKYGLWVTTPERARMTAVLAGC